MAMKFFVQDPPNSEVRSLQDDPGAKVIADTVLSLEWSDITFVVLQIDMKNHLCVSGSLNDGFSADYSEDGQEFVSARAPESLQEMIALLQSYRRGDDHWRSMIEWG
jgi:hypothetical protein